MSTPNNPHLRRFWFTVPGALGVGVTAYSRSEAEDLAREASKRIGLSFEPSVVTEDIDVSDLDQNHLVPNMGPPNLRGVWFPRFNV